MTTPYQSTYTGAQVDEAIAIALALSAAEQDPAYNGSFDIGSTEESGTVTGLALTFTPTKVQLTVEIPADGDSIFANPIRASLSADGFSFQLSGITPDANYRLYYTITGDAITES